MADEKLTLEEASTHCRHGSIAAFVSAAMTFAVVVIAVFSDATGDLAIWNDPYNFADVVLIVLCGWGMRRHSRAAAVIIFIYFLLAKIYLAVDVRQYGGLITGLIFLYFYGRAVQGSFAYHRLKRADDPDYRPAAKWTYYVGIPAVVLMFIAMISGMLMMTGYLPDTVLVAGEDVPADMEEDLRANDILFPGEDIEYLYSYGFLSVLEGGTILSDRAVISYYTDENSEVVVFDIAIEEIESVEFMKLDSDVFEHLYRLTASNGDWITVIVPTEADGDQVFLNALQDMRDAL